MKFYDKNIVRKWTFYLVRIKSITRSKDTLYIISKALEFNRLLIKGTN